MFIGDFLIVFRSATICIAFLMHHQRMTLAEAFAAVSKARPIIEPNDGFMEQLREFEKLRKSVE